MTKPQQPNIPTIRRTFEDYGEVRDLKPATLKNYRKTLNSYLKDWWDTPITELTEQKIEERHKQVTLRSPAQANQVMRVLRALLTFAQHNYRGNEDQPLLLHNPVKRLSEIRAWNRDKRRTSWIKPTQMPAWFKVVLGLRNKSARDYLLFLLLTGLRRNEAACLKWENVDLRFRTITILDPKNHQDHVLPLSDYLVELLERRRDRRTSDVYIFPGQTAGTHISSCWKTYLDVAARSGVRFTLHDLRRTFITTADSLEIAYHVIKRLANHKTGGDVTLGYIGVSIERLRKPMQRITDELLRQGCVDRGTSGELDDQRFVEQPVLYAGLHTVISTARSCGLSLEETCGLLVRSWLNPKSVTPQAVSDPSRINLGDGVVQISCQPE